MTSFERAVEALHNGVNVIFVGCTEQALRLSKKLDIYACVHYIYMYNIVAKNG